MSVYASTEKNWQEMVVDKVTDGKRIAELLSSELNGRTNPPFDALDIVNANPDVEPTVDGARGYDVTLHGDAFASVYVQEDRARVEFRQGVDAAQEAASDRGLRVRPKAVEPPQTLVFAESGAEVKRTIPVFVAAAEAATSSKTQ